MVKIKNEGRNPLRLLDAVISKWEDKDKVSVFEFRIISLAETSQLISTLGESTSHGHDRLDSIGIKVAADQLSRPLQHIINTSLVKAKFCQKWKFSKLTPLLKSQSLDRLCTSSYRPVAALTTISKLVERAAQQQLLSFFESMGQFNRSNHAYRKNLSTTTTLIEVLDDIYQGIEDRNMIEIMTLDQSSAFDCVSFPILLEKLKRYKIGENAREWISNYLTDRMQYVEIGGTKSKMVPVKIGVPQGSVIGPLLYAIYTNELTEIVKTPDCQNIAHLETKTLFGTQCTDCGILSLYADDLTYTIANRSRNENQVKIEKLTSER